MNSDQERVVALFSESLVSKALIFAPDNLKHKNREPADLVWALNDCIFLLYLTSLDPKSKHWTSTEKKLTLLDHNLKQARRWLSFWRQGHIITGKNELKTFSLGYSKETKVVILSVYRNGLLDTHYHDEFAEKHNVALCVSLPEAAVIQYAQLNLTPVDIITTLRTFYNYKKHNRAYGNIVTYTLNWYKSVLKILEDSNYSLSNYLEMLNKFYAMRFGIKHDASIANVTIDEKIIGTLLLNDMSTEELIVFVRKFEDAYKKHRLDPNYYGTLTAELNIIHILFAYSNLANFSMLSNQIIDFVKRIDKVKGVFGIISVDLGRNRKQDSYILRAKEQSTLYKLLK